MTDPVTNLNVAVSVARSPSAPPTRTFGATFS
jgi:hypothetical protein